MRKWLRKMQRRECERNMRRRKMGKDSACVNEKVQKGMGNAEQGK